MVDMLPKNLNSKAFSFLLAILVVLLFMGLLGLYMPTVFFAILNLFWITLLAITLIFLFLGLLVIIGMKTEVSRILDILLEGSLTIIDFVDFIRALIRNFILVVKDFILYITPFFAFLVAFVLYVLLLIVYKTVGAQNDVTWFTVVITFSLIFIIGFLTRPHLQDDQLEPTWFKKVADKFRFVFNDSLEIVVFIFFLTMDSTKLFFLPQHMNIELSAMLGNYDLMTRGFVINDHLKTTVAIIVAAIAIEILRNILRVVVGAVGYYKDGQTKNATENLNLRAVHILKEAIRQSFTDLKDDLLRFITFTTFLIFVFMLFPRLKLLAMLVTSVTLLILDLIFHDRLSTHKKGTDLITRILGKVFKV